MFHSVVLRMAVYHKKGLLVISARGTVIHLLDKHMPFCGPTNGCSPQEGPQVGMNNKMDT